METVVIALQVFLSAIFVTAGVGKLLDLQGSRRALADFDVPSRLVPAAAVALPVAELAVAAMLLFPQTARWGGVGAIVLLLAFAGGIARALSKGKTPDCHCFGQLHSAPAGTATLMRNLVLALLAGVLVAEGAGPSITGWISDRTDQELATTLAVVAAAILAVVALSLWSQNRRLRERVTTADAELASIPSGLPVGMRAPVFALPNLRGERIVSETLLQAGRPVILVFAHDGCAACGVLLPEVARWQESLADRLTIVVVSNGTVEDNLRFAERHGVEDMLVQASFEIMEAFHVSATPGAVAIAPDGTIAHESAMGVTGVEELVRLTLNSSAAGTPPLTVVASGG